jgi:hypothetical protein
MPAHPAGHGDIGVAMRDIERGFRDGFIADAAAMNEGLMREVHQIIDNHPVIAFDVDGLAVAGPGRIVIPVHVRNQRRIGQRRIAHPQPDESVTLDHRIGAHTGRRIDGFLRRHEGATARRIVFQAVVAADHAIAFEPALRKRHQAMPAGIFQRRHLSVGLPVQHDVLAADRARKQCALDIDVPCRGVPGVHRKGWGHREALGWIMHP